MKIYNQYLNNLNLVDELSQMQNKPKEPQKYRELEAFINSLRKQILNEIPKVIPLVKKEIPRKFTL